MLPYYKIIKDNEQNNLEDNDNSKLEDNNIKNKINMNNNEDDKNKYKRKDLSWSEFIKFQWSWTL
tara:strand:- start:318 stop:512 length:195 start_codon:yes stop_codon:yes gene_type:complete